MALDLTGDGRAAVWEGPEIEGRGGRDADTGGLGEPVVLRRAEVRAEIELPDAVEGAIDCLLLAAAGGGAIGCLLPAVLVLDAGREEEAEGGTVDVFLATPVAAALPTLGRDPVDVGG